MCDQCERHRIEEPLPSFGWLFNLVWWSLVLAALGIWLGVW